TQVIKDGGPLPPPPPPTYDPDYIQCPYCQRRFNQSAADRHIKFCQEQAARMPNKGKLGDTKKPPGRTQVNTYRDRTGHCMCTQQTICGLLENIISLMESKYTCI
uniref:Zinc finger C2HC domain-containing protein 1A n=1 Tax=Seriola lalandi dorsalis TaxID=1841481 RepID=A0A3B4XFU3_SERLL